MTANKRRETRIDGWLQPIEKHYLFLYQAVPEHKIKLVSDELPVGIERETFTNKNKQLQIDYHQLVVSPRFEPFPYGYRGISFEYRGYGIRLKVYVTYNIFFIINTIDKITIVYKIYRMRRKTCEDY